jgi:hypothetical protein
MSSFIFYGGVRFNLRYKFGMCHKNLRKEIIDKFDLEREIFEIKRDLKLDTI